MPTSLTVPQVYNLTLDLIGEHPVLAGATDPYSLWLNRNFTPTVERLIRSYNWNFAREFAELSEDASAPTHEWDHRYKLPDNWLRVLPPREGGYRDGRPLDYEIAGQYIYVNWTAPLKLRGLVMVPEPGRWDALFAAVVQYDMALGMAHKFTGKVSYLDRLARLRADAITLAESVEAFEGELPPIDDFDIIRVRSES
jgi:hypothetical protein